MTGCLSSPYFILMLIYGSISISAYLLIFFTILRKRKIFKGTFYSLYLVAAVTNISIYFVKFAIIRLPLFTGKECLYSESLFEQHFPLIEIYHFIHWTIGTTAYVLNCLVSIDRFVVILMDYQWAKYWRRVYLFLAAFSFIHPVFYTYPLLNTTTTYGYYPAADNYHIVLIENRSLLYNFAAIEGLVSIAISLISNGIILFYIITGRLGTIHKQNRTEVKLFFNCLVELVSEILVTFCLFFQNSTSMNSPEYNLSRYLLIFSGDAMVLLPAFVLLLTSDVLRSHIRQLFKRVPVDTVVVPSISIKTT